jgi:hypothetical protein
MHLIQASFLSKEWGVPQRPSAYFLQVFQRVPLAAYKMLDSIQLNG